MCSYLCLPAASAVIRSVEFNRKMNFGNQSLKASNRQYLDTPTFYISPAYFVFLLELFYLVLFLRSDCVGIFGWPYAVG